MAEPRFLIIRLGSMGDIIHTLPAAAALRDSFPAARIDWVVDPQWRALLEGNPELNEVIFLDRRQPGAIAKWIRCLRARQYDVALDFQSLYKSGLLALASGARRRIGFDSSYAREGLVAHLYTDRVLPSGAHKVDHNLTLAARAGARTDTVRFVVPLSNRAENRVEELLGFAGLREFFVLVPGGGWRSKCWPPERYGELHRELARRMGWHGVLSYSPAERSLAATVCDAAGDPRPVLMDIRVAELAVLLRRAKFLIAADSGPLHLASALGTPVVGLFGPTDPSRNGPVRADDIVLRHARPGETTYKRGRSYSAAMLRITVAEVAEAAENRLRDAQ